MRLKQWEDRLDGIEKRGHPTLKEIKLAMDWNTCPVGEARQIGNLLYWYSMNTGYLIEYYEPDGKYSTGPKDETLRRLGGLFAGFISANSFGFARTELEKIKVRVVQMRQGDK